ncbi:DUF2603 domain-containing protein [Campylobacter troglodytis]|uniref:DUF2603 domain-containing protein n=1 Tax=Campylobacter troglodytis TaxID=654363 RepID=UPI001157E5AD|nr:DUF2603 domain-containing protein [Campylobacter troglodytis]TQR61313.1 DUF2603 domain-containing protein [Campylobacter troglodytis]
MKDIQKTSTSMEKINEFSSSLGIKKSDQTVLEIIASKDKEKTLSLKSGHWDAPEPWFVIDEQDKIHTVISIASLKNMLEGLKQLQKENFELRLEKAIYQHIPIDFNDAWIVAMDEIKRQAKGGLMEMSIDLDKLLSDLRMQHPNLFVDMEAMMSRGNLEG